MSTGSNDSAERTESDRSHSGETAPLVFPVGHYLGPFHPSQGAPAEHHIVRVGWDTPKLPDQAHFDMWALAHGMPSRLHTTRWTRQAMIQIAAEADMPEAADAADVLDSLADRGLIVEVTPGTAQARDFAAAYRLRSLLTGLGNTPEDPVFDGIGLAGVPPLLKVRPRVFEIWQWVHMWPSIWTACEGLAWVAGQAEPPRLEEAEPEALLDFMLESFRTLISHNAVYLDVVTAPLAAQPSDE